MRKVKFTTIGKDYEGYYVGNTYTGMDNNGEWYSVLLVEDLDGNIYSVPNGDVKFTSPPINMAPVKRIDIKLMRNVLQSFKNSTDKEVDLERLIKLAEEKNIIIEDTEGYD